MTEEEIRDALPTVHRRLIGEGPTWLADLYGAMHDLDRAREACRRIQELQAAAEPDGALVEMLWHFAVNSYGRCFGQSVRRKFYEHYRESLKPDGLEYHQVLMDWRNKFVAHSVNELEHDIVGVELTDPEQGEPSVVGIFQMQIRAQVGAPMVEMTLEHVLSAMTWLAAVIADLKNMMEADVRAQPLDVIYALPPVRFTSSDAANVGKPRPHPRAPKSS